MVNRGEDDAEFVRWVGPAERNDDLVDEAKGRAFFGGAEHAVLELVDGRLALVRGGPKGISFEVEGDGAEWRLVLGVPDGRVAVARIRWHTHPMVTGPSDGDLAALEILGQDESRIYEIGGDPDGTRIRPKRRDSGP